MRIIYNYYFLIKRNKKTVTTTTTVKIVTIQLHSGQVLRTALQASYRCFRLTGAGFGIVSISSLMHDWTDEKQKVHN